MSKSTAKSFFVSLGLIIFLSSGLFWSKTVVATAWVDCVNTVLKYTGNSLASTGNTTIANEALWHIIHDPTNTTPNYRSIFISRYKNGGSAQLATPAWCGGTNGGGPVFSADDDTTILNEILKQYGQPGNGHIEAAAPGSTTAPTGSGTTSTGTPAGGTGAGVGAAVAPAAHGTAVDKDPSQRVKTSQQILGVQPDTLIKQTNFLNDAGYSWIKNTWQIVRQLSNIAVVLFLFVGSVATTLNLSVSTYGIKRVLPAVIIGTILANFSYMIAEILNSVDDRLKDALFGRVDGSWWAYLTTPLHTLLENNRASEAAGWGSVWMAIPVVLVAVVLLFMIVFLVLLFWIRNVIIGFLIVVSPLAFIAMAMPFSQSLFKKWWSEFIRWTFIPSITAFFMFLAVQVNKGDHGMPMLILTAIIYYLAIRTPFMLGGTVAAVGGFISRNTGGVVKSGVQKYSIPAAKEYLGNKALSIRPIGNIARTMKDNAAKRKLERARLLSGPPVWGRKRVPQPIKPEGLWTREKTVRDAEAELRDAEALEREARREGKKGNIEAAMELAKEARRKVKQSRGGLEEFRNSSEFGNSPEGKQYLEEEAEYEHFLATDPNARRARENARLELETKRSDTDWERMRLDSEGRYREDNPGLSQSLAENELAVEALKENIQGIADKFKVMAWDASAELRNLKKVAAARKELTTVEYNNRMAKLRQEIRETGGKGAIDLEGQLSGDISDLKGRNFGSDYAKGTLLRAAISRASGERQNIEGSVAALEAAEKIQNSGSELVAQSNLKKASATLGEGEDGLIDHNLSEEDFAKRLSSLNPEATENVRLAEQALGIDHLETGERTRRLHRYLSAGNKDVRSVGRVAALKEIGQSEASNIAFTARDAAPKVSLAMLSGDRDRAIRGIQLGAAGGTHSSVGRGIYRGFGKNDQECRAELAAVDGAQARMKGGIELFTKGTSPSAIGELWQDGVWADEVDNYLRDLTPEGTKPVLLDRKVTLQIPGAEFVDSNGERVKGPDGEITPDNIADYISGNTKGRILRDSGSKQAITEVRAMDALQKAVERQLIVPLRLLHSTTSNMD